MRGRDIVDGEDRLSGSFLFLFNLGSGLAETSAVTENISQIQETDGRSLSFPASGRVCFLSVLCLVSVSVPVQTCSEDPEQGIILIAGINMIIVFRIRDNLDRGVGPVFLF